MKDPNVASGAAAPVVSLAALWLCAASVGCTGEISGGDSTAASEPGSRRGRGSDVVSDTDPGSRANTDPDSDPGADPNPNASEQDPAEVDTTQCRPPPSRVVRLSKLELQNSIADLLAPAQRVELPDDAKFLNFSSNAEALVTPPFANALKSTAETLAAEFRANLDPSRFGSDCTTSDESARSCATTFIDRYGQQAFRRPLSQSEIDGLLAVYDAGRETGADGDVQDRFSAGVDYTLRAILQSPAFLYRIELGDPDAAIAGVTSLTPYEVASALSYMLTASPPDQAR